jgi:hypothetical protein
MGPTDRIFLLAVQVSRTLNRDVTLLGGFPKLRAPVLWRLRTIHQNRNYRVRERRPSRSNNRSARLVVEAPIHHTPCEIPFRREFHTLCVQGIKGLFPAFPGLSCGVSVGSPLICGHSFTAVLGWRKTSRDSIGDASMRRIPHALHGLLRMFVTAWWWHAETMRPSSAGGNRRGEMVSHVPLGQHAA